MFADDFIKEFCRAAFLINLKKIDELAHQIAKIKGDGGRLFVIGVGGSAANASHAVNDFRKLDSIEAYSATDNIYELTARVNDEGWTSVFYKWLSESNLTEKDGVLILSVGGGSLERDISANIVFAARYAKAMNAKVFSIVGRSDGDVLQHSDINIITHTESKELLTPISESLQSVILHLLVSYDFLKENKTTW